MSTLFNQGFCTLFWDGDWGKCCQIHDIEYGMLVNKIIADWHLFTCVGETSNWFIALIMFIGVFIGGWFFYPRKKKQ